MPRLALGAEVWQIVRTDNKLEITARGKTTVRTFMTPAQAAAQLERLVAERVATGYQPVGGSSRHPQLEAVIAREPENREHYSVYADWLESHGDPRGRLIALQLAADAAAAPAKLAAAVDQHLARHAEEFLGPLAVHAKHGDEDTPVFAWRFGFIHAASLHSNRHGPLERVVEQLLRHPSGRFLWDLRLFGEPAQPALDLLARIAPASLRRLLVRSKSELAVATTLVALPELRRLSLDGRKLALGALDLPQLEIFKLVDPEMTNATIRTFARAPWPMLQHVRIDFGQGYLTGNASIDEVFAFLQRGDLPALTELGLLHTRYGRELVRELAASPLAARLRTLELSNNQLTDADAFELAAHRDRFPQLASLDVSNNRLSSAGVEALRGFAPIVRTMHQLAEAR